MSEEDSIGWEWMKNRTPAEPVAKEPLCDKEVGCKKCNWTGPLGAFYEHTCADGLITSTESPTPAAQPTGELGTCDMDTIPHKKDEYIVPCVGWQPIARPQPVTGAPGENRAMTSYEWWLTRPDIDRIKLITRLHRESLGLAEPPSPAGARERAESLTDEVFTFMLRRACVGITLEDKTALADIIERAWAGEGK